jgi:hypothetical protein
MFATTQSLCSQNNTNWPTCFHALKRAIFRKPLILLLLSAQTQTAPVSVRFVSRPHHWPTSAVFVKVVIDRNVCWWTVLCWRFQAFWMWHRVVWWVFTDISNDDCAFQTTLNTHLLTQQCVLLFTVFSVLLWKWRSVCSCYCRQLNAVSFSTDTLCCTT